MNASGDPRQPHHKPADVTPAPTDQTAAWSPPKESSEREDAPTTGHPPVTDVTVSVGETDPARTGPRPRPVEIETAGQSFGDYELLDEISRGGMGVVFKARHRTLNRIVALKMILSGHLAGEGEIQRFRSEAAAAAALDHPGIVPLYEVGQHDGQHFFSMGLVEGQSLAQRIAESPLAAREAGEMMAGIAAAVEYAHQRGIVHRDLKPANVLLKGSAESPVESNAANPPQPPSSTDSPSAVSGRSAVGRTASTGSHATLHSARPLITDFGLAKRLEAESGMTASGQILGTPSYMPPEQAAGQTDRIDARSDVYSMGATLYCMLTGRPPFQAASMVETIRHVMELAPVPPRHINPDISRDLETICLKCLEKEPARRYPTALALHEDLQAFLDGRPVKSRPVGLAGKTIRWARRKPIVAALSAAIVLVTLGGVAGIVWQWRVAQRNFERSQRYLNDAQENLKAAEEERLRANQERARAENSFVLARDTVERFLTVVPNHELLNEHGMEPVKEQLLTLGRDHYVTLTAARPDDFQAKSGLANSHFFLAMTLEDVGKPAEAASEYSKAATIFQEIVAQDPTSNTNRRNLAAACGNLANVQIDLGQRAEGIATYRRIGEIQQSLVDQQPDDSVSKLHLAMTHLNLAQLELFDGQFDAAMQSAGNARELAEELQREHPDDLQVQFALAKTYAMTGRMHWERHKLPAALSFYQRAEQAYDVLLLTNPDHPQFHDELADVHNAIAMMQTELGNQQESEDRWELVLSHVRAAHRVAPEVHRYRQSLSIKCRNCGQHFRNTGQFDRAWELFIESRSLRQEDAAWLYTTATDAAGFMTIIDDHSIGLAADQRARRSEFKERALVWLAEAFQLGFDDIDAVDSDAMLNALRDDPEFTRLVKEWKQTIIERDGEAERALDDPVGAPIDDPHASDR